MLFRSWYDYGGPDFPLQRIQGAYNEIGCVAAYSVAKLDNGVFWLGADARGEGIVYRTNGYTGVRISTHAVEWQIQQYASMSDAVAYTYQQDGHAFYVLNFPTANTTWVYDAATQAWHERAGFVSGAFTRQRANCQCNFNGTIIVGATHDDVGFDDSITPDGLRFLGNLVHELIPGLAAETIQRTWCGFRPVWRGQDLPPWGSVGPLENLLVATGYGAIGLTIAAGIGEAVADQVTRR